MSGVASGPPGRPSAGRSPDDRRLDVVPGLAAAVTALAGLLTIARRTTALILTVRRRTGYGVWWLHGRPMLTLAVLIALTALILALVAVARPDRRTGRRLALVVLAAMVLGETVETALAQSLIQLHWPGVPNLASVPQSTSHRRAEQGTKARQQRTIRS